MHDFASVVVGLIVPCVALYGLFQGVVGIIAIFWLADAFGDGKPKGKEWYSVAVAAAIGGGSLFLLFIALILLEPLVRFSFIPY